jgi:hypothetical protein
MVYFLPLFILLLCSYFSMGFNLKPPSYMRLRATSRSSTNIPNEKLQSSPHIYYGLLSGLPDVSSANYYSRDLPIKHAAEFVRKNRYLYDIIETECQSDPQKIDKRLEEIENEMDKFMEQNKVWDRKDLLQGLDDVARKKGNFVCLLGGKSTGKSLVLKEFSTQENKGRSIIYIDMREYSSILEGLVDGLNRARKANSK